MHDLSPVIFRGERDGTLKVDGDYWRPWFFAERYDQAKLYAGRGTEPLSCVIQGGSLLDLTNPSHRNPAHVEIIKALEDEYDDWTCRYSGEPRDAWSFVEGGDLYDYEGTGSGERWRSLWNIALDKYDAFRVLDRTDGTGGQACPVWITANLANIREASPGEHLGAMLSTKPWAEVAQWLEREHSDLLERVERLRTSEATVRLSRSISARNVEKVAYAGGHVSLWRALPQGKEVRPGDWVAIHQSHAAAQAQSQGGEVASLERVSPEDVFWASTDEHKFAYLPKAWRIEAASTEAYFKSLSPEQLRILCDGEMAQIARHHDEIEAVKSRVLASFDHEACGLHHGPEHWRRVSVHAQAVARSLGQDPLVAHVFGWVHDSQRQDEGLDPEHGPRAAEFIQAHRTGLFAFLSDEQVQLLGQACQLHSDGLTEGHALVRACWDADRLDLWRVGIEPRARYLCTDYARQPAVIADAMELCFEGEPIECEEFAEGSR